MSEIVRKRLEDICPVRRLEDMDILEVEKSCHVAFEIIGLEHRNERFDKAFKKAWENSDAEMLWEYIYCVWGCYNG